MAGLAHMVSSSTLRQHPVPSSTAVCRDSILGTSSIRGSATPTDRRMSAMFRRCSAVVSGEDSSS